MAFLFSGDLGDAGSCSGHLPGLRKRLSQSQICPSSLERTGPELANPGVPKRWAPIHSAAGMYQPVHLRMPNLGVDRQLTGESGQWECDEAECRESGCCPARLVTT